MFLKHTPDKNYLLTCVYNYKSTPDRQIPPYLYVQTNKIAMIPQELHILQ